MKLLLELKDSLREFVVTVGAVALFLGRVRLDRQAMLIGQGNKFELWDEQRWNERRDEWLAGGDSDYKDLPAELESLSL
jgi:DNA-binding transcriptional regulator/RsmH inhibitor MraZ